MYNHVGSEDKEFFGFFFHVCVNFRMTQLGKMGSTAHNALFLFCGVKILVTSGSVETMHQTGNMFGCKYLCTAVI